MNTHEDASQSPQGGIDDRRWQAQELARRGDPDADPGDLRIARALRQPPAMALPADFAIRVAARARAVADTRLEQGLLRALVLVFALAAAVVVAGWGRDWMAALAVLLPGGRDALGWLGLAALGALANWGFAALGRQYQQRVHASA